MLDIGHAYYFFVLGYQRFKSKLYELIVRILKNVLGELGFLIKFYYFDRYQDLILEDNLACKDETID